ncbi:hypothetical protein [Sulfuracidifex tepidarius]|uniref:Uncharacterized protein n=1 Tax=Sulfuracidifex tepidarius TaxID=1294262 RepID=A0A510E3A2_9CREN|nr:hypothetical protein [Sulfuracidifex tepidarius]BBG24227.1 hypothetical protein IC006_1534 [Sulfuracidifex tepidarius]BBG26984.1 hypothetical protein IC007_1511 [Sulfuracidifex tepidarius]
MSDIKVSRVLFEFETIIKDHSFYLEELENMVSIPDFDVDKAERVIKRMRRLRRDLERGITVITQNVDFMNEKQTKEEALGILNYLMVVGLKEEKDTINQLKENMNRRGITNDLEKDLDQLQRILNSISRFSF